LLDANNHDASTLSAVVGNGNDLGGDGEDDGGDAAPTIVVTAPPEEKETKMFSVVVAFNMNIVTAPHAVDENDFSLLGRFRCRFFDLDLDEFDDGDGGSIVFRRVVVVIVEVIVSVRDPLPLGRHSRRSDTDLSTGVDDEIHRRHRQRQSCRDEGVIIIVICSHSSVLYLQYFVDVKL
jgi:hypothetical protein